MRTPNKVQHVIAHAIEAARRVRVCERILKTKFGFNDAQIQALQIAARKKQPQIDLAVVIAGFAEQSMKSAHGPSLQPPRSLFKPRRGQIF